MVLVSMNMNNKSETILKSMLTSSVASNVRFLGVIDKKNGPHWRKTAIELISWHLVIGAAAAAAAGVAAGGYFSFLI